MKEIHSLLLPISLVIIKLYLTRAGISNSPLSIFGYGPLRWRESTRDVRDQPSLYINTHYFERLKLMFYSLYHAVRKPQNFV